MVSPETRWTQPETLFSKEHPLAGKTIACVGLGPAGAAATHAIAQESACQVLAFDQRSFTNSERRCTGCGGILQGSARNLLERIGMPLASDVSQEQLAGFVVHDPRFSQTIPLYVEGMISIFRGNGPAKADVPLSSFDGFLYQQATNHPNVTPLKQEIIRITLGDDSRRAKILTKEGQEHRVDFVVGAFGNNLRLLKNIVTVDDKSASLKPPQIRKAAVREFALGQTTVRKIYDGMVHVVVNPTKNVWFAAFVPKNDFVTVIIMGKDDVGVADFDNFLKTELAKTLLPLAINHPCLACGCVQNTITIASSTDFVIPGHGGIAIAGDPVTRPRKNGLEAAIDLGDLLGVTLRQSGYGRSSLNRFESYARRNYVADNFFADIILRLNDLALKNQQVAEGFFNLAAKDSFLTFPLREYMRMTLTGETPYWQIFPQVALRFLNQLAGRKES